MELYDPTASTFPYEIVGVYQRMRDQHPVYRTAQESYVITRFDDVWDAVHDPGTFSSEGTIESTYFPPNMEYSDPPRHDVLRSVISRAFTPRAVAVLEHGIRTLAGELLEEAGPDFDAARAIALPLPSTVITDLLGLPRERRDEFFASGVSYLDLSREEQMEFFRCAPQVFAELLEERRREPADDLMSALLAAEADGHRLTDQDVLGFCVLLLIAGIDTTTDLIGNGIGLLGRHRDQRAEVIADPTLLRPAIEEVLRVESPVQVLGRRAAHEVTLHDVTIPADARVSLCWGAANLDEREFPDPTRFDIHRGARRHLAFGHGVHFCLGSSLARLEGQVVFEELLARWPDYELGNSCERHVTGAQLSWSHLPVHGAG